MKTRSNLPPHHKVTEVLLKGGPARKKSERSLFVRRKKIGKKEFVPKKKDPEKPLEISGHCGVGLSLNMSDWLDDLYS